MSISLEQLPAPLVAIALSVRLQIPNRHYISHEYLADRFITARLHPVFVRSEVKREPPALTLPQLSTTIPISNRTFFTLIDLALVIFWVLCLRYQYDS